MKGLLWCLKMSKDKNRKKASEEAYLKMRKDWGDFNPQTRVVKSKNNYSRKQKYKTNYLDFDNKEI